MGNKYVIIGCGGHAKSILDVILFNEPAADVVFLDKNAKENEKILNCPVVKDYNIKDEKVIIGIGDNLKRRKLSEKYYNNLTSVISKTAYIGKGVKIGKGVFIAHNAYVGIFSEIGDFSVVNTGAIVEHECKLEKCVFIGPNSTLCGKAKVGANTFIGADTTILPRINICSDVTIGAKSLVAKEIQSGGGGLVSRDTMQSCQYYNQQRTLKILFLGASKRTSLLEKFIYDANKLNIHLELFSCEISEKFCPISHLAKILKGPSFKSNEFANWLLDTINYYGINIVIPNMDAATVALSYFKERHNIETCWCVVSSYDLCTNMNDKLLAEKFFNYYKIPTFKNTENIFPKIIKHKNGFGSKKQYKVDNAKDFSILKKRISISDYIIQDFIEGQETSVDIYINKKRAVIGYVLRDRETVSDGEVMECTTRIPDRHEQELIEQICSISGWQGCITLQYIKNEQNIYVIEINPRFGGGATCAIECGLNMPLYILSDYLGLEYPKPNLKKIKMVRARRDFYLNI